MATKKGDPPPLTSAQCIAVIHQIAKGMECLSLARYVHRDLSARNCLISSKLITKVGLPRLTREPYSQEYCKHVNQVKKRKETFDAPDSTCLALRVVFWQF